MPRLTPIRLAPSPLSPDQIRMWQLRVVDHRAAGLSDDQVIDAELARMTDVSVTDRSRGGAIRRAYAEVYTDEELRQLLADTLSPFLNAHTRHGG